MKLITEFEIQYLSPIHQGYPSWPGGERWLQLYWVDTDTQAVFTKGLNNGNNMPFEIYLQSDELLDAQDFSSSWQCNLVYETGKIMPRVTDLAHRLEKNVYLTLQIVIDGAPPDWSLDDENGNIGLFLGLHNPIVDGLVLPPVPLNIKLMRPAELSYCLQNGNEGRMHLAELYKKQGNATISGLQRASVL